MNLRETVKDRLVNDYIVENGVPRIGRTGLVDVAEYFTESLNWFPVGEFGSTDYYEMYVDFVNEINMRGVVLA